MPSRRTGKSISESEKALEESRKKLAEVKDRGTEVSAVANDLREFRRVNHISAQLEDILTRTRGNKNDT